MPTLDARVEDIVRGNDIQLTRTITLVPTGDSLEFAWLTIKADIEDDDPGVLQKAITLTNVPGTGHISDDGAGDQEAKMRFDLLPADTLLLVAGFDYVYDLLAKTVAGAIYTPEGGIISSVERVGQTTS